MKIEKITEEIEKKIQLRLKDWVKRKIPRNERFPYKTHDPNELGEYEKKFEKYYLVGKSWKKKRNSPILVAIGFNDWKLGVVAEYLPEYRIAFLPRRNVFLTIYNILKIKDEIDEILIWGYHDKKSIILNYFLNKKKFKIVRMEDGFLRSSELGANHATPYSLVIDRSGIYYDGSKESDLEKTLNLFDTKDNDCLVKHAERCIEKIKTRGLLKYNPASIDKTFKIKTKKIVLVLGQVANDSAIKYGNPNNWKTLDLVKLAFYEHQNAEIIYRPHPEEYEKGKIKKLTLKSIKNYAKISEQYESLIDLFEVTDHVYTISSLSGFEAAIRDIKVTVVGTPFYAGWGFTDDRSEIERRNRQLSVKECFAGAYLIYAKYLYNLTDSVKGFNDTVLAIISDKESKIKRDICEIKKLEKNKIIYEYQEIYNLRSASKRLQHLSIENKVESLRRFFGKGVDNLILSLLWALTESDKKNNLLKNISNFITAENLSDFFKQINRNFAENTNFSVLGNVLVRNGDFVSASQVLEEGRKSISYKLNNNDDQQIEADIEIDDMQYDAEYNLLIDTGNYEEAYQLCSLRLSKINEHQSPVVIAKWLNKAAYSLYENFSLERASLIYEISAMFLYDAENRKAYKNFIDIKFILNDYDKSSIFEDVLILLNTNPEVLSKFLLFYGYGSVISSHLKKKIFINSRNGAQHITALLEAGYAEEAIGLIEQCFSFDILKQQDTKYILLYSSALHSLGRSSEAYVLLFQFSKINHDLSVLQKLFRLSCFLGEFEKAEIIQNSLLSIKKDINPTYFMAPLLAKGEIGLAFRSYRQDQLAFKLSCFFPEKVRKFNDINEILTVNFEDLILAVYGPGDEIRFASIYGEISTKHNNVKNKITISCDKRLFGLFSRSFPNINFISTSRSRFINKDSPLECFNLIPSTAFTSLGDNNLFFEIKSHSVKRVLFVTDFISQYRVERSDFPGHSYLIPNEVKVKEIKKELLKYDKKFFVGINWRSSLNNLSRSEGYLSLNDILPLFELDEILFVNLQYDRPEEEIAFLNKTFPDKFLDFNEIDLYNDFDSVASLIKCLNLVIAPATSIAELAGAIGIPTWLFSTSKEISWRASNLHGQDIWHSSVKIFDVSSAGDKNTLVTNLKQCLNDFVNIDLNTTKVVFDV